VAADDDRLLEIMLSVAKMDLDHYHFKMKTANQPVQCQSTRFDIDFQDFKISRYPGYQDIKISRFGGA
jgi:hypothetical protein